MRGEQTQLTALGVGVFFFVVWLIAAAGVWGFATGFVHLADVTVVGRHPSMSLATAVMISLPAPVFAIWTSVRGQQDDRRRELMRSWGRRV